jgi:hypothetical protein
MLVLVLFSGAGCSGPPTPAPASTAAHPVGVGPEATVGASGATVTAKIGEAVVTAVAPAGVAETGTRLSLSSADVAPGSLFAVAGVSAAPIRLVLGSGIQPKKPITLTFNLTGQPGLYDSFTDRVRPVIAVDPSAGTEADLLQANWDPSQKTVTATTDHLSVFQLVVADPLTALAHAAEQAWKHDTGDGSDLPCRDKSEISVGGTTFTLTAPKPSVVGACLRDTGQGLAVDLTSASPQYYDVAADPAAVFSTSGQHLHSSEQLAVALHGSADRKTGLLTPKGAATLQFPAGTTSAKIRVDVDPVALQLETILTGLDMLGADGDSVVKGFQDTKSAYDCLVTAYDSWTHPGKDSSTEFTRALGDISQCGLAGAEAALGQLDARKVLHRMSVATSLFAQLPTQLMANIAGIAGEFNGDNHIEFTLTSTTPAPTTAPTLSAGPAILNLTVLRTDNGAGIRLGPNHFQISKTYKHNGRYYADMNYHWTVTGPKGSDWGYCKGHASLLDSAGQVIARYDDDGFNACHGGGAFATNTVIYTPGRYSVVVDVEVQRGPALHASEEFTLDP